MEEIQNKRKTWDWWRKRAGRFLLPALLSAALITGCGQSAGAEKPAKQTADGSDLEVHFIDVGQADAALVLCDGENIMLSGRQNRMGSRVITAW